jgi:hypothetical protein
MGLRTNDTLVEENLLRHADRAAVPQPSRRVVEIADLTRSLEEGPGLGGRITPAHVLHLREALCLDLGEALQHPDSVLFPHEVLKDEPGKIERALLERYDRDRARVRAAWQRDSAIRS